ncbi:MAG: hypothetical protein JKX76_03100 [Colwellia sp.]|nr:hypothetical protein [Colwellia sp.]
MKGTHVVFFKGNGEGYSGVVTYFDPVKRQVIVQDEQGGEWTGRPEQVFKNDIEGLHR